MSYLKESVKVEDDTSSPASTAVLKLPIHNLTGESIEMTIPPEKTSVSVHELKHLVSQKNIEGFRCHQIINQPKSEYSPRPEPGQDYGFDVDESIRKLLDSSFPTTIPFHICDIVQATTNTTTGNSDLDFGRVLADNDTIEVSVFDPNNDVLYLSPVFVPPEAIARHISLALDGRRVTVDDIRSPSGFFEKFERCRMSCRKTRSALHRLLSIAFLESYDGSIEELRKAIAQLLDEAGNCNQEWLAECAGFVIIDLISNARDRVSEFVNDTTMWCYRSVLRNPGPLFFWLMREWKFGGRTGRTIGREFVSVAAYILDAGLLNEKTLNYFRVENGDTFLHMMPTPCNVKQHLSDLVFGDYHAVWSIRFVEDPRFNMIFHLNDEECCSLTYFETLCRTNLSPHAGSYQLHLKSWLDARTKVGTRMWQELRKKFDVTQQYEDGCFTTSNSESRTRDLSFEETLTILRRAKASAENRDYALASLTEIIDEASAWTHESSG